MRLSPRLTKVAEFVDKGLKVADVGTDHAYLPIYLVENNISPKVIATDINEGPIENAKKSIEYHMSIVDSNKIDLRLSSGLSAIEIGEIDIAIIAGMGGLLIRDIILESLDVVRSLEYLIIQPQNAKYEIRKWLCENNFKILEEKLAFENDKVYEILKISSGVMECKDDIYFEIGINTDFIDREDYKKFLNGKIIKYKEIVKNLKKSKNIDYEKLNTIEKKINKMVVILEKII